MSRISSQGMSSQTASKSPKETRPDGAGKISRSFTKYEACLCTYVAVEILKYTGPMFLAAGEWSYFGLGDLVGLLGLLIIVAPGEPAAPPLATLLPCASSAASSAASTLKNCIQNTQSSSRL